MTRRQIQLTDFNQPGCSVDVVYRDEFLQVEMGQSKLVKMSYHEARELADVLMDYAFRSEQYLSKVLEGQFTA